MTTPESRAIVAGRSTEDVRLAGQDNIKRVVLAVQLLTVADDLPHDVADGIIARLKIVSGAVNVLASRVE